MVEYGVILFHTTSAAFAAEKALIGAGVDCKPIPPPREFSNDCGVALRFDWEQSPQIITILGTLRLETAGVRQLPEGC